MNNTPIVIAGAGGGVTTTTTAAITATISAMKGQHVLLVAHDIDAMAATFGAIPSLEETWQAMDPNLTVCSDAAATIIDTTKFDLVVRDAGRDLMAANVWCVASDYRSLRVASKIKGHLPRCLVYFFTAGSSLDSRVASDVISGEVPLVKVNRSATVQREFDAGVALSHGAAIRATHTMLAGRVYEHVIAQHQEDFLAESAT